MDAKKRDHFVRRLLEERDRILSGLENLSQDFEGATNAKTAEFEENARVERDREYLSTLISQDAEEVNEITEALKRVLDGTYGICIDCAKEISEARLEAQPAAARCVECQAMLESRR